MVPPEVTFGPDDLEAELVRFMSLPMVAAHPDCTCSCHRGTMVTNHVVACCDGAGVPKDWRP